MHRPGVDADDTAVLDEHAPRLRPDHDPGARGRCILEPRPQRRLLRAERTAVAAVAADDTLLAADDVARHRVHVPAERLEAAPHHLVAPRGEVVVGVDTEPVAHRVEARPELGRGEAEPLPLLQHLVGSAKRGRVVDDRAAAEAGACDQPDALVVGRRSAAATVEAAQAGPLGAVEIAFRPVAARLEHDDVQSGRGEHCRRNAATGARTDHADVAVQLELAARLDRLEPRLGRVSARPERPGIADLLPAAGEHVRECERSLPESLEAGPHQRNGAVTPAAQDRLSPRLREPRVAGQPRPQKQQQPLPLAA